MTPNSIETIGTAAPFTPLYPTQNTVTPPGAEAATTGLTKSPKTGAELDCHSGPMHTARIDVQGECFLRTGQSVLGLGIQAQCEGTTLGRVRDILFSQETNTIQALILGQNEMAGQRYLHVVPWSEVRQCNADKVVVESVASKILLPLGISGPQFNAYQGVTLLANTCVLDEEGQLLGTLTDICFDESTGCISGYRTATGFMLDILPHKQFLPTSLLSDF